MSVSDDVRLYKALAERNAFSEPRVIRNPVLASIRAEIERIRAVLNTLEAKLFELDKDET